MMSVMGRSRRIAWTPWLALLLGGVATAVGTEFVRRSLAERDFARFEQVVTDAEDRIVTRLENQIALLRATGGLFGAGLDPSVEQFAAYVDRMSLTEFYPGVQGVGFIRRIRPGELDEVVARMRAEAFPDFHVWPDSASRERHAVVLLEPRDRRNRAALGYDISTEPVRAAALERARDTGWPTMTGRVTLIQEVDPEKQPGVLILVPVYEKGERPSSVEERRDKLLGFAYSPLRAHSFFGAVFEGAKLPVALDIYDGERVDPQGLLFDTEGPRSWSFEIVHAVTMAGRPWTIRYTTTPAFDAKSHRGLLVVFAAVGAVVSLLLFFLVRLEVRARRAKEFATTLRERLLAIVGHDLRNPLGAITMGMAVLMRKEGLDPSVFTLVRRIERSAQRMTRLIADVLDFARIQQGRVLPLERVPADVHEVVRQVVDEFQLAHPEAVVRLEVGGPVVARVDPERLAEAVSNLVSNAFQHGRGPLTVRVRDAEPGLLTVEVHNQGPAIPTEDLPRLFDPYAHGRERGEPRVGGLGLGLYIAQEIVRGHGGRIEVRSSPEEGTTFAIVVPRIPA